MAKKETQTQTQTDTSTTEPQVQSVGLNLQDLIFVTQLIQLTTQRGSFRAEELEQVGAFYNKLVAFLRSTGAITPADAPADSATTEEK